MTGMGIITLVFNVYIGRGEITPLLYPAFLKAFAEWNPVSSMVQAVRELFGNLTAPVSPDAAWPLQHPVIATIIWVVIIGSIGMSLAVWRYSKGRDN